MGLRHAQLPGQARTHDGVPGGRAGAAVVAGDEHHLGACLGDAGGNGADACLGYQLHADAGVAVGVLHVVDELGQILDGVDVMVRRRRDQADAGGGVPGLGDPRIYLLAGQMAALAGLGALGHFNLNLLGAAQVLAGDAKAAGGNLLDGGAPLVPEPARGFAALAGVGLAADAVHGDSHALMGLLGDGAVAHGTGLEPLDDGFHRLHLVDGDTAVLGELEAQQTPQGVGLVSEVHQGGVLLENLVTALPGGLLQEQDGLGIVHVVLFVGTGAQLVNAHGVQCGVEAQAQGVEGLVVVPLHALADLLQAHALHTGDGVGEVLVDDLLVNAHALENLGGLVGLDGGNAHFGGDLHDAVENGAVVVVDSGGGVLVQQTQGH